MRNLIVDVAKGLGGILVILGHAMAFRYDTGMLLATSHLATPLFIFLSGVFLNPEKPWRISLLRKGDALLKPYFVVLIAMGMAYAMLGKINLLPYLAGVLYATGSSIAVLVPLWFLPHLFLCLITCSALLQLCNALLLPYFAGWILVMLLLLTGQALIGRLPDYPFSADLLPLTSGVLLSGYLLSSAVKKIRFNPLYCLLALMTCAVAITWGETALDMNRRILRNPLVTSVLMCSAIYLVLSVSALLSRGNIVAPGLAYLGRNFLLVLLFHLLLLRWIFRLLVIWMPAWGSWHVPLACVSCTLLCVLLIKMVHSQRWLSMLLLPAGVH